MKVKIIKNLSDKYFDRYSGQTLDITQKTKEGNYLIKFKNYHSETVWLKDEVKEIK